MDHDRKGNGAAFYMCDCRLRRNFFVHSVEEHFEYDGDDDAFARRYEALARERGRGADLPPVEEVLEDIRAQREERRRAPLEAAQRAGRIASDYKRLHPEVYRLDVASFLDPGFVEVAAAFRSCPDQPRAIDTCAAELASRGLLTKLRDGLYTLPAVTATFCDLMEAELAHFEASGLPKTQPNTMNRYGIVLRELGLCEGLLDPIVFEYINPIATRLLSIHTERLDSYRAFTVKYEAQEGKDQKLNAHFDNSEVTLNINFGGEWTGGQVTMMGLARQAPKPPLGVTLRRGHALLHAGCELHQAEPVLTGTRHNLILWCRSSGIRNVECPMCWSEPRVVATNAFGHEGFTVPPCALASRAAAARMFH